jgi:hypothetical protein
MHNQVHAMMVVDDNDEMMMNLAESDSIVVVDDSDVQIVMDLMLLRHPNQIEQSSILLQPYHCISITSICHYFLFQNHHIQNHSNKAISTASLSSSSSSSSPPRCITRSYAAILLQHALQRYHQQQSVQSPKKEEALESIGVDGGETDQITTILNPVTKTIMITTCRSVQQTMSSNATMTNDTVEDTVPCTGTNLHAFHSFVPKICFYSLLR